jgi:hypothetical protein
MTPRSQPNEQIATALTAAGLLAVSVDGWVYVQLPDGRAMCISAEYGASLDVDFYDSDPTGELP